MSEMPIEEYIAQGGKLSSPANVTPRYRGELLRLMASFVDSELAGSAGFADVINSAPGLKERIAAARIVLEKTDHAEQVLSVMETFGADGARYAVHHSWGDRLSRDAEVSAARQGGDMRLSVFYYPLQGWADAVVMNVLMGLATVIQLEELAEVSYQPLADVFRTILPRERRHMELGVEGLKRLAEDASKASEIRQSFAYWRPRVAETFGHSNSKRFDNLARFGLRHQSNEALLSKWDAAVNEQTAFLGQN